MKYFKCGNCQAPYKIDDTKITSSTAMVECTNCKARNVIRLGPVIVAQNKNDLKRYSLKLGNNTIGRRCKDSKAEILIDDNYVSRIHATIQLEKKDNKLFFSITDNKSMNGTFNKAKNKIKPGLKYPFNEQDFFIVGLTKITIEPSV